ncbi:homeotic protein caudal isoform X1 [Aedes albopictus]|uniref:Homeobox domain-containing protein n=1 Tax=Aedes albopictus TaxID=7160 RepID=A0ABM1XRV5_AEDAL
MVSYYNHFAMYPKNHSGNLPYSASAGWYPGNYQHQPPHPQFIGDGESSPQPMYYPHPHVFHQSSPDWSGHENFTPPQTTLLPHGASPGGLHLGQTTPGAANGSSNNNNNGEHCPDALHSIPSPPITVSGSDMSSPGAPNGSSSPQIASRPTPVKSPFEWMKKQSYQSQPNPGGHYLQHVTTIFNNRSLMSSAEGGYDHFRYPSSLMAMSGRNCGDEELERDGAHSPPLNMAAHYSSRKMAGSVDGMMTSTTTTGGPMQGGMIRGKTRTKDKYRVVYTDQQRLELEKEFHYTRYITIRRKSELAQSLQLSERQVKIWFQNRRAKDRKQKKKAENGPVSLNGQSLVVAHSQHNGAQSMSSLLVDTKPKLEPSLHLSHLHQMSAMSMGMSSMGLHHAHHSLHPHLGVPSSQHLNQGPGPQVPPGSLSIM